MTRPGIVFGVDESYLEPLLVTITSLAVHGGIHGDLAQIHVLHTDLDSESCDRLTRFAARLELDLTTVVADGGSERFPVTDWISPAAYLRLQMPNLLPDVDRLLYLDCDLIATDTVAPLLELDVAHTLAAALDTTNPTFGEGDAAPGFASLGISPDQPYFNSGVLVIDPRRWTETGLTDRCIRRLLEQPEHIRYWDQDALNLELATEGWTRLDPKFNAIVVSAYEAAVTRSGDEQRLAAVQAGAAIESTAHILHFAGPFKPWRPGYPAGEALDRYAALAALRDDVDAGRGLRGPTSPAGAA